MKHIIKFSGILLFAFMLASCSKDTSDYTIPPQTALYMADLRGVQEVPPNGSTATATFLASYDSDLKTLTFNLMYTGITPTAWHIHKAIAGTSGPVQFDLGPVVGSPLTGNIPINATELAELDNAMYYVNIHSAAYPDGEIRGQIIMEK
jgi:hypothetical protein